MPVYVDQFIYENKSKLKKLSGYKEFLKWYRFINKQHPPDMANAIAGKALLSSKFEQYCPDQPITHMFRRFAIEHTDFIGDGGRP